MRIPKTTLGYLLIFSYCLMTAFFAVAVNKLEASGDPFTIVFFTFLFTTAFFTLINLPNIRMFWSNLCSSPKQLLTINIVSVVIWLGVFWSLKYLNPAESLCVYMSMTPIATLLFTIKLANINQYKKDIFYGVAIIILLSALVIDTVYMVPNKWWIILGVIFALAAGITGAFYNVFSQKMHKQNNFTATQVLAMRFYLLLLISLFMSLHDQTFSTTLQQISWLTFLGLALLSSVLPLFFKQQAIIFIGARKISYVMPFTPVAAYGIELLTGAYKFHPVVFVLVALVSILLFLWQK